MYGMRIADVSALRQVESKLTLATRTSTPIVVELA